MIEPITPNQMENIVPDKVIEVFNELIKKQWNGVQSIVIISVADKMISQSLELGLYKTQRRYYARQIVPIYEKAGWQVELRGRKIWFCPIKETVNG